MFCKMKNVVPFFENCWCSAVFTTVLSVILIDNNVFEMDLIIINGVLFVCMAQPFLAAFHVAQVFGFKICESSSL